MTRSPRSLPVSVPFAVFLAGALVLLGCGDDSRQVHDDGGSGGAQGDGAAGAGGFGGDGGATGAGGAGGGSGGAALDGAAGQGGGGGSADAGDAGDAGDAATAADASDAGLDAATDASADAAGDAGDARDATPDQSCTSACAAGQQQCGPSGGVRSCVVGASGCLVWSAETACGPHSSCAVSGGVAACACNPAPAGCTQAGTFCAGNNSVSTCAVDGDGCFFVSATAACGARQTCTGTLPGASCTCNAAPAGCSAPGTFCNGAGSASTCASDANGCLFVSGTTTCGTNQTCTGSLPGAACTCNPAPPGCTGSGSFCASSGTVSTCTVDANGCKIVTGSSSCGPHQTCTGSLPGAACTCNTPPAGCTGSGTFCPSSGSQSTCTADANGCFTVTATASCAANQSCKGNLPSGACSCDNTCTAGQVGTYCTDATHVATCASDANGCHLSSGNTACLGTRTCQGPDGSASCQCVAVGTTLATGCTTPGATLCSATVVLTCVADPVGGCNVWSSPVDCATSGGGGLVCGTKSGVAACQCPDHAGGDTYVDPVDGSDSASGVFPTGIQSPSQCRYKTLGKALSLAVTSGNRVLAATAAANLPASFTAETFPLSVASGVTLTTTDVVPTPADYTIAFNSGSATVGVALAGTAVFEGFTFANAGGNAAASAVSLAGDGTVDTVALEGTSGSTLAVGINVGGTGTGLVNGTTIAGFTTGVSASTTSATTLALTNDTLTGNGTGVSLANGKLSVDTSEITASTGLGVSHAAGTLTIGAVNIHANGTDGLSTTGGTVTVNTGAHFDSNGTAGAGAGVRIAAATVTLNGTAASPLTASSNSREGVVITSGKLTGSYLTTNANGTGATKASGIRIQGSAVVTLGAASDAALAQTNNGLHGIMLNTTTAGSTVNVTRAAVTGNGGDGYYLDLNGGAATITGPGAVSSTITSASNTGHGATVHRAALVSGVVSLTLTGLDVHANGTSGVAGHGIWVRGDLGAAAVNVKNSFIYSNNGIGLRVEEGNGNLTQSTIQANDISQNAMGGVVFATASTLSSFVANKIHGNTGDQVQFLARQTGNATWNLRSPSTTCDANSNQIYCYSGGGVGIRITSAPATSVDARNVSWENLAPSAGVDYVTGTSTINATLPCTAVTTCP